MKRGVNKRAVTNVEMVVAIVIFVFTIFSMLILFNVFHKAENESNSLEEFEQRFLERAGNYTLVGAKCNSKFNYIYNLSFELNRVSVPSDCGSADVVYSIPTYGKIFSYEQLDKMNQSYYNDNDYEVLKGEFGGDFILSIRGESGESIFSMTKEKPQGSEIYAKNFRIKVYNKNRQNPILNAIVNVQTW